jgi:hypothetical protein
MKQCNCRFYLILIRIVGDKQQEGDAVGVWAIVSHFNVDSVTNSFTQNLSAVQYRTLYDIHEHIPVRSK